MACICQGRARRRSKPPPPPQSTPPGRTCKAAACSDTSMAAFVARSSARSLSALARACPALCTSWETHARTRCRTVTRACRAPATCRFTQRLFHPTPFSPNAVCVRVCSGGAARGAPGCRRRERGGGRRWPSVARARTTAHRLCLHAALPRRLVRGPRPIAPLAQQLLGPRGCGGPPLRRLLLTRRARTA
jgi:hypothetical protein